MKILITGAAGFIGFHLAKKLLEEAYEVIGIDNLNNYYDQSLKITRLSILQVHNNFTYYKIDIKNSNDLNAIIQNHRPTHIVNLAAQAGVRYSIDNPYAYLDSNLIGFLNILEACRKYPVEHLIYASSSSVYGGNRITPFSTNHNVDHPISLYAATKKSNELMAHAYSHLYGIPTTGLRFFTVYGPYGRPDMAYFSFTKDILENNPIYIFNKGLMERDFTYIDDIVEGIYRLLNKIPEINMSWDESKDSLSESFAPYKIYNIGNNKPVQLMKFIEVLETTLDKKAIKIFKEMQPGDVLITYADISDLAKVINFKPSTSIESGLNDFVKWYLDYYKLKG